ncbi:hypothetical protein DNHGIG_28340 [Collibacillus ludicampi]|uniref:GrpB family protein n=1 Tax=Collibacillus ludicampi TaxID=2771369 RepID=A0AAV4LHG5_9BACL|nr:GrpB family protein [Collibacillus ludicampi]GIM47285.1 hypothetical protein DNHGIG_28340 [Collibacillus ludicampi]
MENVFFSDVKFFYDKVEILFKQQKERIKELLPDADVQHVGSTAIPGTITKGDLDIQVRVTADVFPDAVKTLTKLYELNDGSIQTDCFRAFKDDTFDPPLGVQLTVIGSEHDIFYKIRDVLLNNPMYRKQYNELKRQYEGKDMDDYRSAKRLFFERLMETPEYIELNKKEI